MSALPKGTLGSVVAGLVCAGALLATAPGLPMVWDEGDAIVRAEGIRRGDWQYTTRVEGHPALYGMVIALGQWASAGWLGPLTAARFGPILLFSVAAGAMFYRMRCSYSMAAAVGAATALLLMPRMFAHAHFASFDGPLTSCWILAWATFPRGGSAAASRRVDVLWGLALGMTLSCKATGWLAPLPFLVWAGVYRERRALRALAIGLPIAMATFFVLNPPLWQGPIQGFATFLHLNLNRAANPGLNISTQFLGRLYNLDYPLPWYNTLFWTAVTVPVGILLLAGIGVVAAFRQRRANREGMLLAANWLVLLVVRAVPGTPPHDAERLLLPTFAFLAALAGVGCEELGSWAANRWARKRGQGQFAAAACDQPAADARLCPRGPRCLPLALLALIYAGSATGLVCYAPQWLSYYSLLIGGLPGAAAVGMEPTYYWDGLDRSVLDWLHAHTAADEKICFAAASTENLALMQRWGTLRRATQDDAPGAFRWYVLQHRPSGWQPADRWLIAHARPACRKTLLGVPLVEVYQYGDHLAAVRAAAGG